jgi:hypothetical protein
MAVILWLYQDVSPSACVTQRSTSDAGRLQVRVTEIVVFGVVDLIVVCAQPRRPVGPVTSILIVLSPLRRTT